MERNVKIGAVSRTTTVGEFPRPHNAYLDRNRVATLSPNSRMVAISVPSDVGFDVTTCITDRDGNIVNDLGTGLHPMWSPDSTRFTIERSQNSTELFQSDGSGQFVSIAPKLPGEDPLWNQDCSKFTVRGAPLQYIFDRDGRQVCDPINSGYNADTMGWSPDGEYLLMYDYLTHVATVYNGKGVQTYTKSTFRMEWPHHVHWAYDSSHLAMAASATKVMVWDIRDDTSVTFRTGNRVRYLSWSPDATRLAVVTTSDTEKFGGDIEFRDGKSLKLVVTVPVPVMMIQMTAAGIMSMPLSPCWSEDSSKFAVLSRRPLAVMVFSKEGKRLSTVLQNTAQCHELSNDFMYLLSKGHQDVTVTCLVRWSDRTNHMFSRQFRETVRTVLCVASLLDKEDNERQLQHSQGLPRATGLPRLPMEIWLHILDFLQAAPARRM